MIKKSILIIDDDIILLKTAEEILSDLYSVSVAKGGKQGITLLKKGIIPNLILLDIAMPEMDGYMTLEKIKGISGCEEVPVKSVYLIATRDLSNLWLQFFYLKIKGLCDFLRKRF